MTIISDYLHAFLSDALRTFLLSFSAKVSYSVKGRQLLFCSWHTSVACCTGRYGPRESDRREAFSSEGRLQCDVKIASYARRERKGFGQVGRLSPSQQPSTCVCPYSDAGEHSWNSQGILLGYID